MEQRIFEILNARSASFDTYYRLLTEWNEKFNLTAITERNAVYVKHFADSLLGEYLVPENATLLDIGAGAGFPSLPIKIVRDDVTLTMVDSLKKRVNFLSCLIDELKLDKTTALHARAEDLNCRGSYDCVVARAVAPLNTLCEYCLPFVKTGGIFIAYKADDCEEETAAAKNAVKILGGDKADIIKRRLDDDTVRSLVVIGKVADSPAKYPRGKNLPRKSPL